MTGRTIAIMVVLCSAGLVGCANDSGGSPSTMRAPRSTPPPDDGPGPGPGSDPDPDPDPDPGPVPGGDAGMPDLGAPTGCAGGYVIDAPTAPGCAATTRTCMESCMDETCWQNCLMRDPSAAGCEECLYSAFLSCVNSRGCQPQYDAIGCCAETCADPEAEECYTTTCASQVAAYDTCVGAQADACYPSEDVCFP